MIGEGYMKKAIKFAIISILAAALVLCTASLAAATDTAQAAESVTVRIDTGADVTLTDADGDGYYDIGTADELYAFAAHVNLGNGSVSGELTADITVNEDVSNSEASALRQWTPIGKSDATFSGSFDGNGKSIEGLYVEATSSESGFFGKIRGATVKNFEISGKIVVSSNGISSIGTIGAVCGAIDDYNVGESTVFGIISHINIEITEKINVTNLKYVGGITGFTNQNPTIEECVWDGAINLSSTITEDVGGVIGHIDAGSATLKNCASYGTIIYIGVAPIIKGDIVGASKAGESKIIGCVTYGLTAFGSLNEGVTVENCYYRGNSETDSIDGTTAKTADEFYDGVVAQLLGAPWGQRIEGVGALEIYPTLGSPIVYFGYTTCDKAETEPFYTNKVATATKPGHSTVPATCTAHGYCEECNEVLAEPLGHSFGLTAGEDSDVCLRCAHTNRFDFASPIGPILTLDEMDLNAEEIRASFPSSIEVKYEDGKYMVKNIGAVAAVVYNSVDYIMVEMELVDGYWVCEMSEETYNAPDQIIYVEFYGKDGTWQTTYENGLMYDGIHLKDLKSDALDAIIVQYDIDIVEVIYSVNGKDFKDIYAYGAFASQEIGKRIDDSTLVKVTYNSVGNVSEAMVIVDNAYYFYYEGYGWTNFQSEAYDPAYACEAPTGYEDADNEYFGKLLPFTKDCEHTDGYSDATCTEAARCLLCGAKRDGGDALGHDIHIDEARAATCADEGLTEGKHCSRCSEVLLAQSITEKLPHEIVIDEAKAPTCTEDGLTEGSHCLNCDTATVEQEVVSALGHSYDVTDVTEPTCTEDGTKTYTCGTCGGEYTEKIQATGHVYDGERDKDCNLCSNERKVGLSGGAIAGIATGSAVVATGGGFSLFWFVIKKKRWSDLVALFKK